MYLSRILMIVLALLSPAMVGAEDLQPCQQVIVAGNSEWPPYTIAITHEKLNKVSTVDLTGIGIELAEFIFAELDIPIIETTYSDPAQMQQALRSGEIDVVVSTYSYSLLDMDANVTKTPYLVDQITVALPISKSKNISDWDNLVGLKGIQTAGLVLDDVTNDYMQNYLQVTIKDGLTDTLSAVINGEYDYVVGSHLQLSYAIKAHNFDSDLIVMKQLLKGGDVHMAFSKNSGCKLYEIYMQKRLQDYKNNGTVEKILNKYIY